MGTPVRGRVVVGVDDSPAGLRTLRVAVTQARLRDRELVAVRAFSPPRDREPQVRLAFGLPGSGGASQSWRRELAARERQALSIVERAFGQAMGVVPDTVRVRSLAVPGLPGPVLVDSDGWENDLLVVGTSASRHPLALTRLFRRSVSCYCAARAACPVLLVPPHELAREVGSRHRPWRRRELENLLTTGLR